MEQDNKIIYRNIVVAVMLFASMKMAIVVVNKVCLQVSW
jgi:hypothetical protein